MMQNGYIKVVLNKKQNFVDGNLRQMIHKYFAYYVTHFYLQFAGKQQSDRFQIINKDSIHPLKYNVFHSNKFQYNI